MATDPLRLARAGLALALLGLTGCLAPHGLLFTRTTAPYHLPFEQPARRADKSCRVDVRQIKEPVSRANLSVLWTDRAVTEAMRRAGMTELRYADLQTFSLLNELYVRRRLVFYGE